ncbi:helicase-related protein [Breoghania sp.]|uniref:helicase-related protein n=1 Tax=Breoghania sp. TaxID=2065378 RepID=UPI0032049280
METKVSARTRIEVVTEGVFARMILNNPDLPGVAAVLFDEFHERSLDGDLGLGLGLDVQSALREDLRLLVMSATLDAAKVAALLGEAPVIESKGRMYPIETRYLGRDPSKRMEAETVKAVRTALSEETGSILVFLPGQSEIRRVAEMFGERLPDNVTVAPLYGVLTSREQDAAIRPAPDGLRKVVLATSIAQTSLTIQGVQIVIDTGLARVPRYEPATDLTRLETVKVSRAAADQRRGRAGRTEPGVCYRLWDEAQTTALAEHDRSVGNSGSRSRPARARSGAVGRVGTRCPRLSRSVARRRLGGGQAASDRSRCARRARPGDARRRGSGAAAASSASRPHDPPRCPRRTRTAGGGDRRHRFQTRAWRNIKRSARAAAAIASGERRPIQGCQGACGTMVETH